MTTSNKNNADNSNRTSADPRHETLGFDDVKALPEWTQDEAAIEQAITKGREDAEERNVAPSANELHDIGNAALAGDGTQAPAEAPRAVEKV